MKIALIGTRGVPARYGGFETAVEEVGRRLATLGHAVTVYCRGPRRAGTYLGMELVNLPTIRFKTTDTLAHTALSVVHSLGRDYDAAIVFNAANAPLARLLKLRGIPFAVHVDGLEWRRLKWGRAGRRYYLWCEQMAARTANALIADSRGIQRYYATRYGVETTYIAYGTPAPLVGASDSLLASGLRPGEYHLVVARFEPENHVDLSVSGFVRSDARTSLVVVGGAPYGAEYVRKVHDAADGDERVHFLGGVWDQRLLDELYANCRTYIHGHSVGGTNPSLLRAMGLGAPVLARDVEFNREVLGPAGHYFSDSRTLAELVDWTEQHPDDAAATGRAGQLRANTLFDWDEVAGRYESLCARLKEAGPRGFISDHDSDIADDDELELVGVGR